MVDPRRRWARRTCGGHSYENGRVRTRACAHRGYQIPRGSNIPSSGQWSIGHRVIGNDAPVAHGRCLSISNHLVSRHGFPSLVYQEFKIEKIIGTTFIPIHCVLSSSPPDYQFTWAVWTLYLIPCLRFPLWFLAVSRGLKMSTFCCAG